MSHPSSSSDAIATQTAKIYSYADLAREIGESSQSIELKEGVLLMSPGPTPQHQKIAHRFHRLLEDWVTPRSLGDVFSAPVDMVLSPHQVTQPDVLFVDVNRVSIVREAIMGPADLVAEVVSLGSRNRDRIEKRDLYEQYGVQEYWILDPEAQTVEVLHLESGRYNLRVRARPGQTAASGLLPGFQVDPGEVFQALR